MSDLKTFSWKCTVVEALNWGLYKKSLSEELIDNAEQMAIVEIGQHFKEIECFARVQIKNGFFVVTFHEKDWRLSLKNGDEVFYSDPYEENMSGLLKIYHI